MNNSINVVLTADKNYVCIIDVVMISILKNISKNVLVNFYIFSYKFSNKNIKAIKNLESKYNCKVYVYTMEDYINRFEKIDESKFKNKYISIACYFRLLMFDILPKDVSNCFYVDSDMIVACDLSTIKLPDNKMFGAVIEPVAMQYRETTLSHCYNLFEFENFKTSPLQYPYFNAGFFYVNLKKARELNIYSQIKDIIKKYPMLPYADQDILNIIFGQKYNDLVEFLPIQYNIFSQQDYLQTNYDRLPFSDAELKQACKKTLIYHYAGQDKPWLNSKVKNYHCIWWKYAKCSQYYLQLLAQYYLSNTKRYFLFVKNNDIHTIFNVVRQKLKRKLNKKSN